MAKRILLIEDDPSVIQMYRMKFEEKKYEVIEARTGISGLELAKSEKPDIILLDVIIPQMDGFAVLKKLREDTDIKRVPVILLTNLGQESDKTTGESLGAQDYLVKANYTPTQVLEKVEKYLKT